MASKKIVLNTSEWNTSEIKYMAPKVNDKGMKSISIISKQTNRMLHIGTPLLMTWGISDFVDEKGDSDGKFSISLNFPNEEYRTPGTDAFLQKLKDFEKQILEDAVKNSELWWGEQMSLELVKHTFFPFLKYSKNRDTKKIDYSKPPTIRAKVPCYDGKWGVEIYDSNQQLLFPSENTELTPMDFVPKLSKVACGIQCSGIWIGGKGWGITWKLFQCIVKPPERFSVMGSCHLTLSNEDKDLLEKEVVVEDAADGVPEVPAPPAPPLSTPMSTQVEDSDEEDEKSAPQKSPVSPPPPPPVATPVPSRTKTIPAPTDVAVAPVSAPTDVAPDTTVKKKVVKKKVVA
jgi:hypothetical protein